MKKTVFTISSLSLCLLMALSATGTAAPSPKGDPATGSTLVLDEVKPGSLGEWKERFDPKSINPLFGCEEFTSPFDRSTALRTWARGNTFDTCETKWIRRVYATGLQQTDGAVVEAFLAFSFDGSVYNLPSIKLDLLDERGQVVAGQVYFGKGIIGSFNRGQLSNTGHRELPSASGLQRFDLAREFGSGRRFSALAVSLMNYACQGKNSVVFDHLVLRPGTGSGSTRPQIPVRTAPMTTGAKTQLASQSIDSSGGVVENSEAGIKMTIPPAALKEPVTITIVPQAQHPPLFDEPIPAELAAAIRIGPSVDLGPSGTRFQVPVEVQWRLPDELRTLLRKKGSHVEVGYYNGKIWQPLQNVRTSADGMVSFQTTHFTLVVPIVVSSVLIPLSAATAYVYQTHAHPEKWITADSKAIKDYIIKEKITFPDSQALAKGGTVPLGLKRSFTPHISWILVGNGETMLTQDTAFCQEATYFTASILRASKDPRFQNFICVRGKETNPKTHVTEHHMWIEIEIDGKIWVVDTASVENLSLMLKEDAVRFYTLRADQQFTDKNSPTTYVGLSKPPPLSCAGWVFDSVRFEKSEDSLFGSRPYEDNMIRAVTEETFKAHGRDGFLSVTYNQKQVVVQKSSGKTDTYTVKKEVKISWKFIQPMDVLTPGQKIGVTGTLVNTSSEGQTVTFEMDFMPSHIPATQAYKEAVPFFKGEQRNWLVGGRDPAFQGEAEVPFLSGKMAIRCKFSAGGVMAAVYRIYRWAPAAGTATK